MVVVKGIAVTLEVGVRFPGRSNRTQCRQWLDFAATFLRSCAVHSLSRGDDGSRRSLHASAYYREYNEGLVFSRVNVGALNVFILFASSVIHICFVL